jgi:hypothetical protein
VREIGHRLFYFYFFKSKIGVFKRDKKRAVRRFAAALAKLIAKSGRSAQWPIIELHVFFCFFLIKISAN